MHYFLLKNGRRVDIFDGGEWRKLDNDRKKWDGLDLNAGGSYRCKPNGDVIFVKFSEIDKGESSPD